MNVVNMEEIKNARSSENYRIYNTEFGRSVNTKAKIINIRKVCKINIHWRKPLKLSIDHTQCTMCTMHDYV